MLECNSVSKSFGGVKAVRDCTLKVDEHAIVGLIGPNGAGKTTLFNVIAGVFPPTSGEVYFKGEKISGSSPWQIAGKGIARTFQTPHGFPLMTVMENLMVAPLEQAGDGLTRGLVGGGRVRAQETENHAKAMLLLESIGLMEYRNELVVNLSAGDARLVEMIRQLMLNPSILLLDEPAAGINPALTGHLLALLRQLRADGLTILAIDHNLGFIMELCDYIYVLAQGRVISHGTPAEIIKDPAVIQAYLGKSA
jgi:ABC-type branched-subunit amino acid transport system ATPase component